MAEKTNANIGFEKQLWDAACVLWGHIPAAEYRKVIIGLIFLRYISTAFEKRYNQLVAEGDGFEDDRDAYEEENIFFVPEAARWSTIAAAAHTPEIGIVIDNAMRAIEEDNKKLKNVLPKTMQARISTSTSWAMWWTFSRTISRWIARKQTKICLVVLMSIVLLNLPRKKASAAANSIRRPALSTLLFQS